MLSAAREIAHEQGLAISYQLGDAEALPFPVAEFDAVISTFGLMAAPPAPPPPSPFVWGTREWTATTLGRDFQVASRIA
jgi:hypothetical protein